jgi:predicted nucleic-acid-binding protein
LRIVADTNLLVRLFVQDDLAQADLVTRLFVAAEAVIIPAVALCEAAWVLRRRYRVAREDLAAHFESLLSVETARLDEDLLRAGVALIRAGGDFADGVIAREGVSRGGGVFVSFDRDAVRLWREQGGKAAEPAELAGS